MATKITRGATHSTGSLLITNPVVTYYYAKGGLLCSARAEVIGSVDPATGNVTTTDTGPLTLLVRYQGVDQILTNVPNTPGIAGGWGPG